MNERNVVLYHGGCWDGFCAAWLLYGVLPPDETEFIPVQYGEDPPNAVVGAHVYIVDFSYKRDVLEQIYDEAKSLIVLDHHKTAKDELEGLPYCVFDMHKSGARLTHEYIQRAILGRNDPPHWLVNYTEDRDLWNWELYDSQEVNAWLRSHPLDFDLWDQFAREDVDSEAFFGFIEQGRAILRVEANTVAAKVKQSHIVSVNGFKWKVANATTLISETANELAQETGVGCCWFELPSGEKVYSLRSKDSAVFDVSTIAKSFGGGGPAAAGFKADKHPWS